MAVPESAVEKATKEIIATKTPEILKHEIVTLLQELAEAKEEQAYLLKNETVLLKQLTPEQLAVFLTRKEV